MAQQYAKDQPQGFKNRIEKVAIVGAGGSVGKYIAQALVNTGKHTVTAITRVGSTSKIPEGVKTAEVDYDNEQSLVEALTGQEFLAISLPVNAPPGTQEKLITAAAKAGVPWIMPNSYTSDIQNESLIQENFNKQIVIPGIEAIEKAGVASWIALASSFWYEYSIAQGPACFGFDLNNKKVTFFDDGKTRINTSTWIQSGRAMASLLSLKILPEDERDRSATISQWRNKPLYISSFLVSQRDILDSIHRVTGSTDDDWTIEYENSGERYKRALDLLQKGDQSAFAMAMYTRTFFPNGDGNYGAKHGLANSFLELPEEDLDEATKRAVDLVAKGYNYFGNREVEV